MEDNLDRENVLIVEDEVVVSTDLKRKIERMGYNVTQCVRYGEKALDAARDTGAHIVIMDIHLKGEMDGTEAAEKIVRELALPIIFMTAYSDDETIGKAKLSGPYSYLTKPVRYEELKINVEMALYKKKTEEKLREKELYFRTVADFAYDWETWVGTEGELIYTSPSCLRMTGYHREDFEKDCGLLYSIIQSAEGEDKAEEFKSHRHDKQNKIHTEFTIRKSDGTVVWLEHICQPVFSPQGRYLGRRASNRDITERKAVEDAREKLIVELQEAMENIKTLNDLLPICCNCKKIRDDEGYWNQLEDYFKKHTGTEFTHGLCPDCAKKLYPRHFREKDEDK